MKSLTVPRQTLSSWEIESLLAKSNELEWQGKFLRARLLAWRIKVKMAIHQLRYHSPAI